MTEEDYLEGLEKEIESEIDSIKKDLSSQTLQKLKLEYKNVSGFVASKDLLKEDIINYLIDNAKRRIWGNMAFNIALYNNMPYIIKKIHREIFL